MFELKPLTARMLRDGGINVARIKASEPEMKHSQFSECNSWTHRCNVEDKSLKSAGFAGFI